MTVGSKVRVGPEPLTGCDDAAFVPSVARQPGMTQGRGLSGLNEVAYLKPGWIANRVAFGWNTRCLGFGLVWARGDKIIGVCPQSGGALGDFSGC